ncbi:MAG: ABC transporter permease [Gammaproteobacteria bacterium]|jgi:putative ABC transport system permease protein|nr:ABC transporter permease [Gammaproteobacteria bacterium]
MLIGELIAVALQSVRANLFRSMLTMLGIIIGVASVIAMLAIGAGARGAVDQQIEALGAGLLSIRPGQTFQMGVARAAETLTTRDVAALARDAETIVALVPERSGMEQVKLGNRNRSLRIIGTTAAFADVHDYRIEAGQMFSAADDSAKRALAVLGAKIPPMLGESARSIIGQTIYIRGLAFEVVGVFSEKGTTGFRNVDEQVWLPLNTARVRLFGSEGLDLISARPQRGVDMQRAIVDIERILRREHGILPGRDNDFSIQDPRVFLDFQETAAKIFSFLLASIASVSLVVGGIGIMNIMLVSVTERTREIGIRKALGATRRSILAQFLVEAMMLCLIGGAVGVLLGVGVAQLLNALAGWRATVSPAAIALAFGFSAFVGLFFGLWPARKAARMDPIAALRYE